MSSYSKLYIVFIIISIAFLKDNKSFSLMDIAQTQNKPIAQEFYD